MNPKFYSVFCLILVSCVPRTLGQKPLDYTLQLNEKYTLKTKVDLIGRVISFEATVQTTGWVGLGVSPGPNMMSADIFIGWVNETTNATGFGDYYGSPTENKPIMDRTTNDNWNVTGGYRNATTTVIKFSRNLNVTSSIEDREIKDEDVYLIWAFGSLNTTDPEQMTPLKHETNSRGSKKINLLKSQSSSATSISMSSFCFGSFLVVLSTVIQF